MTSFRWTDHGIRMALGHRQTPSSQDHVYGAISTDTRTLRRGDVFVAISGERFDGHDHVAAAVSAGCKAVVVSESQLPELQIDGVRVHCVPDSLVAYGDLARHRRRQAQIPVVGITGSSGKTTVKDMATGALQGAYRVHATDANYNNRIGLPRTILEMPHDTEVLVLEMGTNEPGEVRELARIAEATVGVVTTVSETHVEKLKDLDGVLKEKLDLLDSLDAGARPIVGDDPLMLAARAREIRPDTWTTGWSDRADSLFRPTNPMVRGDGTYAFGWADSHVELAIAGRHGVYNALLALAVARAVNVPDEVAIQGLQSVTSASMRGQRRSIGSLAVVVDCYNANPQSVVAAAETLGEMATQGRRVVVLGSMLELGPLSAELHGRTLERVLASNVDKILVSGEFARTPNVLLDDPRIEAFVDVDEMLGVLPEVICADDLVLLKASRGVRLERALPLLESRFRGGLV